MNQLEFECDLNFIGPVSVSYSTDGDELTIDKVLTSDAIDVIKGLHHTTLNLLESRAAHHYREYIDDYYDED